jgi:two-component system nitrate/nitrite response regulator NarL
MSAKMDSSMNKATSRIRVLLVDDHPVVRRGIAACLSRQPQIEMVGEAADGKDALEQCRTLMPDVVVTDVEMPVMNGAELVAVLNRELPSIRVLVLSVYHTPGHVLRMVQAGAAGYMFKEAAPEELVRGIERVASGEPFFSEDVAQIALNQVVRGNGSGLQSLTVREREVLIRIADGMSNKEIADALGLGVRTVETHRERAMRKLDIHSVAGLTKYALAQGWVSLNDGSRLVA